MRTVKMKVEYEGTRYNGWQRQSSTENTIQKKLEMVFSKMEKAPLEIQGAGRTDAGVHAKGQIIHFHTSSEKSPEEMMDYANEYLPMDIGITEAEEVHHRFHSRLNAKGKTYIYRVWNSKVPNVLDRKFVHRILEPLKLSEMKEGASYLIGTHDFQAFTSAKKKKKSTIRTIESIKIHSLGDEIQFIYKGDGFLYHMVRIMTGTLLDIGLGKREPRDIESIIKSGRREEAGPLAPANGLVLWEVHY